MAITPTNNLGLSKPDRDENFNVANIYNKNLDTIDAFAGEVEGFIENSGLVAFGQYWSNEQAFSATREPMKCPTLRHSGGNFEEYFAVSSDGGTFTCIKECIALVSAYVGFSTVPTGTAVLDVAINNEEFQRNQAATNAWSPFQYDFSVGDTIKFEVVLSTAWTANRGNHVDFVVLNEKIDEPLDLDFYAIGNNRDNITNSQDINALRNIGNYKVGTESAGRAVNGPLGSYYAYNLTVSQFTNLTQQKMQEFVDRGLNTVWRRSTSSSVSWRPWVQEGFTSGRLYANDDLNNIKTPGRYACANSSDAATILNRAVEGNSHFILEVIPYTANANFSAVVQLYYFAGSTPNGAIYYRYSANAETSMPTWSAWIKYTDAGEKYKLENRTAIPFGADLNEYAAPGSYVISTNTISQSLLNSPPGLWLSGTLTVNKLNDSANAAGVVQELLTYDGTVYTRYYIGGTFQPWITSTQATGGYVANVDLNDYVKANKFTCAANCSNLPVSAIGILKIENTTITTINSAIQTYTVLNTGVVYRRNTTNAGTTWSAWKKQVTREEYNALLARVEALEESKSLQLGAKTNIPANANINTYNQAGTYGITAANAASISNLPAGTGQATLIVNSPLDGGSGNVCDQLLLTTTTSSSIGAYIRQGNTSGNSWSDWVQFGASS